MSIRVEHEVFMTKSIVENFVRKKKREIEEGGI